MVMGLRFCPMDKRLEGILAFTAVRTVAIFIRFKKRKERNMKEKRLKDQSVLDGIFGEQHL